MEQLPEGSRLEVEPPVRLQLRFSFDGRRVVLDGACAALALCVCVRCLERFTHPLNLSFRYVFASEAGQDAPAHVQLTPADIEVVCYDGDRIDLIVPVCEQIQLGMPTYPHCGLHCKGLCAQCGANLNSGTCACASIAGPQSPFAVLGTLKKKT